MVFTQHEYECSGCGRKERAFFPREKFPIEIIDWDLYPAVIKRFFCNWNCLRKWITSTK